MRTPVHTARGDRLVSALILSRYTLLRSQALVGLAGFAPSLAEGRAAGELERGSQENGCPSCSEDMMLPATASRLLVEVGYREGRSDIAQGPGAAIGDRLIVGDAVTSPTWPASTWTESGQYDSSSRSLAIEQMARMPRDHQVLVGRYDPGRHGGAGARDPRATFGISLLVQGDAKPMRLPAGTRPYLGRVLADARSEDERIESAERCGERSELASDAVDEEVDRLFCGVVAAAEGISKAYDPPPRF